MSSPGWGLRLCAAVITSTTVIASAGCAGPPTTDPSAAGPAPTIREACEVAPPTAWLQAFAARAVDTGPAPAQVLAVGPAGEVAVGLDASTSADLLLIGTDRSVSTIYPVAEPRRHRVGSVTMDDRWMVVGVEDMPRVAPDAPRGTNAGLPTLDRIDVIDRRDRSVRTIASGTAAERQSGGRTLDSFALFDDSVYWITRDSYPSYDGTLSSYDLTTGAVADVQAGRMREVRATPMGLTWFAEGQTPQFVVREMVPPPAPVAAVPGLDPDASTLASDGTAFAWITGVPAGGKGIGSWTPDTGLKEFTIGAVFDGDGPVLPVLHVDGPYVVFGAGRTRGGATILDVRSGAVTFPAVQIADAGGGTLATVSAGPSPVGLVRTRALPPLTC